MIHESVLNKPTEKSTVKLYQLEKRTAAAGDFNGVPTLTPLQDVQENKPRNKKLAAIVGGAGAALLVLVILVLVYVCLTRAKRLLRRDSMGTSSAPSPPAETQREIGSSPFANFDNQILRHLGIWELEQASSNFSKDNIVGEGGFGIVYKGLLQDGSVVAIKRRHYPPSSLFLRKVKQLGRLRHPHLVKLIGYCEDSHQQLLVYEYIANGDIGNHLYDGDGLPSGKLGMIQRLSIALGAARGLEYLHSLSPPILHMRFKTSNVLVDENFKAKVSDYGLSGLISGDNLVGASSGSNFFCDPELDSTRRCSERSDMYSFGVFLLELTSGRRVHGRGQSDSEENLLLLAKGSSGFDNIVDRTLAERSTPAARSLMELALACLDESAERPSSMSEVVEAVERIQEREMGRRTGGIEEEVGPVTLGSELFK